MGAPDFWDNPDAAQKTAQAVTQLKEEVGIVHNLEQRLDDLEVMVELALEEPESGMEEELEAGLEAAKAEIEHLELGMLLNGEYDANGRRVYNPSALPWERNNFNGAFELKSENGFGLRIEVQQGNRTPFY